MSTPRSIAARASVPNAISLPVAKPRVVHRLAGVRSSWSLDSILYGLALALVAAEHVEVRSRALAKPSVESR
jgi:hypothetical protein